MGPLYIDTKINIPWQQSCLRSYQQLPALLILLAVESIQKTGAALKSVVTQVAREEKVRK